MEQQISEMTSRLSECEAQYKGSREEVRRRKENYTQKIKESGTLQLRIRRTESDINVLRQEIDKREKK
jgi:chromosome segregation ATPase